MKEKKMSLFLNKRKIKKGIGLVLWTVVSGIVLNMSVMAADLTLDDEVVFNTTEILMQQPQSQVPIEKPEEILKKNPGASLEQVFDEDKEAEVEENRRHYPKWQGRRKRPVNDYDYSIKVNKKTCTVTIYKKEENGDLTPFKAMVCSIGREGHDTPEGKGYKTSDYYDWRLMVDNTFGRYAVRFNGSIMFHSVPYYYSKKDSLEWQDYNKLGKPASLGCIRLAVADAKWIFDNCKRGTEVEVYSGPASTDPLGTPKPIELDTKSEYRNWDPKDLTPENPWLVPVE
ncbi:MAG: L,D-transpeptidase [Lachnospiraceae bacterium]|nr:L,D-transpeptidase [Lachnospiraceae bacterium]